MELKNIYPEKIPQKILNKNYIDDIILYALSAFGSLHKAEFNQINKTTFYKYLNKLLEKKYISSFREGKKAIYEITPSGQTELLKRLEFYKLDFETIIELEKKKINSQISRLSKFFDKYNVNDEEIKIDFLQLYNELTYDESFNIFSEEQFNKLLLFIVMNHPKFFDEPEKIISKDRFLDKFNTYIDGDLSETDIDMFIQEVVEKNRYGEKIYKVELNEDISLFFRVNSKLGKFFETTIQSHLRYLNYLKSLLSSKIYSENLEEIIKLILNDLIKKYRFFNPELRESLYYLIEHYIFDLQQEHFGDPFIGIDKIRDFSSLLSDFPSLSFDFKSLKDSDDDELLIDIHTTFKRIKEKEPMNELYDNALKLSLNENPGEALLEINKCIELEPNNYEYLGFKSQILYELENYEDALQIFEETLKIGPLVDDLLDKIDNATYQAELLTKLKRYEEALDIIENQIPVIISEDKEQSFQKFLDEEYILYDYYKIEANIYYQQEKYKKALDVINKDLKYCLIHKDKASHDPQYAEAISESYLLKSRILYKLDKPNEALVEIDNAIEISHQITEIELKPEEAALYYQKAKIYLKLRDLIYAYKNIKKAAELSPKNKKYLSFFEHFNNRFASFTDSCIIFFELKAELDSNRNGILIDKLYRLTKEHLSEKGKKDFKKRILYYVDENVLSLSKDNIITVKDNESFDRWSHFWIFLPAFLPMEYIKALFEENKWEPLEKDFIIKEVNSVELYFGTFTETNLNILLKADYFEEIRPNLIKFVNQKYLNAKKITLGDFLKKYKLIRK